MAGIIQVDVLRWRGDWQLAMRPFACPLAEHKGVADRQLYCFQVDQFGQECHCPYYGWIARAGQPQYRTEIEFVSRDMAGRGADSSRYAIFCHAARPSVPPGA